MTSVNGMSNSLRSKRKMHTYLWKKEGGRTLVDIMQVSALFLGILNLR